MIITLKIFDCTVCCMVPQLLMGNANFLATNKCCHYLKYLLEFAKLSFQLTVVLLQNDHSSLQPDDY